MSKRAGSFILLFFICTIWAYSVNVHIAPILYIDETKDMAKDYSTVHYQLIRDLQSVESGIGLNFRIVSDESINPPQSLSDAIAVCRLDRAEYLLYGFVVKREHTIQAEIRLFDYENRMVIQIFYGIDDYEHYDRMIADLSHKILEYLGDAFNLRIFEDRPAYTMISIPVDLGYWTPLGSDWVNVLLGTGIINTGVTFIPTDNLFTLWGKRFYLSTGLNIAYRLGVGNPRAYSAYYNNIMVMVPARLHMELTDRHRIFLGAGFLYFVDILSVEQKYADPETQVYSNLGLELMLGYSFKLTEKISLYFNNTFDFEFSDTQMVSYSPRVGVDILLYKKEFNKKW